MDSQSSSSSSRAPEAELIQKGGLVKNATDRHEISKRLNQDSSTALATNVHEKSRFLDTKSSDVKSIKKQESSSRSPGKSHKSKKHGHHDESI